MYKNSVFFVIWLVITSCTDYVEPLVNQAPAVNAGPDQTQSTTATLNLSAHDEVNILVQPPVNQAPTVSAGPDQTIFF